MSSNGTSAFPPRIPAKENVIVDNVLRYPATGSKALVVGAGVAGMMTALECWRKGIDVEIIERATENPAFGDSFLIGPSAFTTFHYYPNMLKEYAEISHDANMSFCARDGTPIIPLQEFEWNKEGAALTGAYPLRVKSLLGRRDFTKMLLGQCKRLGIPITYGVTIEKYEEDVPKKNAAAVAVDGRRFTADVVIASDGLGTKSHALTLGHPVRAFKTGFVAYRGMYSAGRLKDAPLAGEFIRNLERPRLFAFVGDKIHCILVVTKNDITLGMTTEEEDDLKTTVSWSSTVSNEFLLSRLPELETWSPLLREVIAHAPDHSMVRWSLCFRNPQSCWTSAGGRVVQVGDSAHSFLPTSANGATQALEDALSLPECLRLGGKENLGVATKVHELLRFQRVSLIQHSGFVNMQDFHIDIDNKKVIQKYPLLLMGKWLWAHNPEKYATENFSKAIAHLRTGSPFENTNLPPGHKWSNWTVEEEMTKQKAGILTMLELKSNGDWSIE
ncbi:FAD/NAD(P)-binding domain-containing protein [Daldinia sp. FL1419]|nr:FAD/NAD(P)-binding domain-containing protein [Daldinia sp. FL1419]